MATWAIHGGDCRAVLATLPERSVQTCVTSPPYFGLRDYGTGRWDGGDPDCDHKGPPRQSSASTLAGNGHGPGRLSPSLQAQSVPVRECRCGARRVDRQIGLEPNPTEFVGALVAVFREVRRVLRDDGTVWLNLGDSYAVNGGARAYGSTDGALGRADAPGLPRRAPDGYKPKDLLMIPALVALALRADGWYLRSEIIWSKPNPMPESVTDRPTTAHEHLFLLSKQSRYFYNHEAIREPDSGQDHAHRNVLDAQPSLEPSGGLRNAHGGLRTVNGRNGKGANKRSVWTVATQPYPGAHFAVFPPKLIEPCILAGSKPGDTVLDPFAGAGTTGLVALRRGRSFVGIELNPDYAEQARNRIRDDAPLFNVPAEAAGTPIGKQAA